MSLFNADHTLNIVEWADRLKYWTDYAKTGASRDVETSLDRLGILHSILFRHLNEFRKPLHGCGHPVCAERGRCIGHRPGGGI